MQSVRERVRVASAAATLACVAVFVALRIDLVSEHGQTKLDEWVAERIGSFHGESHSIELLERLLAAPGSRKGALLVIFAVAAWAWFRQRDLRWGLLLAAVYTGTAATVGIVKVGVVLRFFDADLDRAYLSLHAANTTAVFGMLLVMSMLTHERPILIVAAGAVTGGAIAAVGFSVIAAGHHWLTDVVGGIAVGGAWVFGLTPAAYAMWRRRRLADALRRSSTGDSSRPRWSRVVEPRPDDVSSENDGARVIQRAEPTPR